MFEIEYGIAIFGRLINLYFPWELWLNLIILLEFFDQGYQVRSIVYNPNCIHNIGHGATDLGSVASLLQSLALTTLLFVFERISTALYKQILGST